LGYLICIASLPAIRRNASAEARDKAYRLKGGYTIPVIGFVICIWLLMQSKTESWIAVSILIAIGAVLYGIETRTGIRGNGED
jgi:amino acid transporter